MEADAATAQAVAAAADLQQPLGRGLRKRAQAAAPSRGQDDDVYLRSSHVSHRGAATLAAREHASVQFAQRLAPAPHPGARHPQRVAEGARLNRRLLWNDSTLIAAIAAAIADLASGVEQAVRVVAEPSPKTIGSRDDE